MTHSRYVCPAPRRRVASVAMVMGARWRRGGKASPRQVRSPRCRYAGAAPAASLALRTHEPRLWCVLSPRWLRWCDSGGGVGWSEQRYCVAAALSAAPERAAGGLACLRVMPRALWCGLGRAVGVLPCRRCEGGCGLGAVAVAAAQILRRCRWAPTAGVASSRWAPRPTRRGCGDLARSLAAACAASGGGGSRFLGAAVVWRLLRWCWQQNGVCLVVVRSRGLHTTVVRSRTRGAIHTAHTHTHHRGSRGDITARNDAAPYSARQAPPLEWACLCDVFCGPVGLGSAF